MLPVLSIHYIGAVGFAFVGVVLVKKSLGRSALLSLWMFIGMISSAMLFMLGTNDVVSLLFVSFLLGVSLGLGFPSCLAYFGQHTTEEDRGRLGGMTFLFSGLGVLVIGFLISTSTFAVSVLILTLLRGIGLILFLLLSRDKEHRQSMVDVSYKSVLFNRSLLLYLIPWLMFCLVNFFEMPMLRSASSILFGESFSFLVPIAEFGIAGLVALVAGSFADSIGRKRIVIFGFMVLGIAYAILGIFPNETLSWYLLIILDGIAWGVFSLMFFLVIWADLAGDHIKEKYYLIGVLPFLISSYMQIFLTPYAEFVPVSTAFSLASFFLFLAVLPLLLAPETLSEKEIEKKRLKKYLEDVKKIKNKHERKK